MKKRMMISDLLNCIKNNTQPKEIVFKNFSKNYESDKFYWVDRCKQYQNVRSEPVMFTIGENIANNMIVEYNVSILTAQQKQYIANIIKPFRNQIIAIIKEQQGPDKEYIEIVYKTDSVTSFINLPPFDKNTMYTGMEPYHRYTLEELEI